MKEEHEPVTQYHRMIEDGDDGLWEVTVDGEFMAMLFTDELPFELPVHVLQETRDKVNAMFHYMDDERLQDIIDSIDPFEIECEELVRFE